MLKHAALALLLLMTPCRPARAAEPPPTADQVIARNVDARGGPAALAAIRSLSFTQGRYSENGQATEFGGNAAMRLMRPYYKVVGDPGGKPFLLEGYDGSTWEWYAEPGVTLRTVGAASAAGRHMTNVEGPWIDYAAKGSSVVLLGREPIGGRPAWRLRLTMMDGFTVDGFFDAQTWLEVAERISAPIHAFGQSVSSEQRYEDWRPVGGVLFPFRSRTVEIGSGRELDAMQWGRIEANLDIPRAWFSPPAYQPTPVQMLIQQLFAERDDAAAMLWTYHDFRRAHPEVDVSVTAQVAGYQVLKTGQAASAIALLERSARDYPGVADTAFGLGRAYATADRPEEARRAFQRALAIDPNHARAKAALAGLPRPATAKPQ
jgi:hypothetical protein